METPFPSGATAASTTTAQPASAAKAAPVALAGRARRFSLRRVWRALVPYAFLTPFLLVFAAFFFLPFLYALDQSLYEQKFNGLGLGPPQILWVGLANYVKALHDPSFLDGFKRVLLYGAVQIPIMMIIALTLAFLMDSAVIRFRSFFRLAFFLPFAVPGVVAAIMWSFFYSPGSSPIISVTNLLGLPAPSFLGANTVLWSIANISTWLYTGYNMVIFFSALQGIPQEIYESGRLDGLSEVGIALRLKLPLITPALVLGVLFSLIGTLQLFNEPLILDRLSNAITSTFTPNIYAYNVAFVDTNFYYGGALAVIMGIVTFVFSYGFLRLTRRQSGV